MCLGAHMSYQQLQMLLQKLWLCCQQLEIQTASAAQTPRHQLVPPWHLGIVRTVFGVVRNPSLEWLPPSMPQLWQQKLKWKQLMKTQTQKNNPRSHCSAYISIHYENPLIIFLHIEWLESQVCSMLFKWFLSDHLCLFTQVVNMSKVSIYWEILCKSNLKSFSAAQIPRWVVLPSSQYH